MRRPQCSKCLFPTAESRRRRPTNGRRSLGIRAGRSLLQLAAAILLASSASAQFNRVQLKSFCNIEEMGLQPLAGLMVGSDGALYGTTLLGAGSPQGPQGTAFKLNQDGTGYQVLHRFSNLSQDGMNPYAGLIEGTDQILYGTTLNGGSSNLGTIFCLNRDGSGYRILRSFGGGGTDGSYPLSSLLETANGVLMGTSSGGGVSNQGVIFQLNTDGSNFQILHHFAGGGTDGAQPAAGLIRSLDGTLIYGTTQIGGRSNQGTIFKLGPDGSGYGTLHHFAAAGGGGAQPYASLIEGIDGRLYGTTFSGGTSNLGCIFRIEKDGNNPSVLQSFTGAGGVGAQPYGGLVQDIDGSLYGTTVLGGASNLGTVFRLDANGSTLTTLHHFTALPTNGALSYAGLTRGGNGRLFGTTYVGGANNLGTVFRLDTNGSAFAVIRSFVGEAGDAANPYATIQEGSDGVFYGATWYGGITNAGAVFRINRDGSGYNILRSFTGVGGDGSSPYSHLIEGSDRMLYGTTTIGGRSNLGTLFRMNRDGTGFTNLHSFGVPIGSGTYPYGAVLEGANNLLYGTTLLGGASGRGTVYRVNRDGSAYTTLYTFTGTTVSGSQPYSGLLLSSNSMLYLTTTYGGTSNLGTIFRIATTGAGPTILRSFTGANGDGSLPYAGLCLASDGVLYGTTRSGGTNTFGTVFKIATNGTGYTVIHQFAGSPGDGAFPSFNGVLTEGADRALYGTTFAGGVSNLGTIFRLNRDGSGFTVLHSFIERAEDGAQPETGLMRARDGALYGATLFGGSGCGTLFRLEPAASFSITTDRSLSLAGPAGYRYQVQRLDEWLPAPAWQDLTNVTLLDSPAVIVDPSAATMDQRYYRALLSP